MKAADTRTPARGQLGSRREQVWFATVEGNPTTTGDAVGPSAEQEAETATSENRAWVLAHRLHCFHP